MLFIRLMRCLRGYVGFLSRSGSVERFLNMCARHRVPLWDCRREDPGFSAYTTARGYRRLHGLGIAKKSGAVPRVRDRRGLPFLLRRYRRRIGVLAGAAVFIAFFAATQQFVWVVRVEGNKRVDSQVLVQALGELGVRRGTPKSGIDPKEVQLEVQLAVDDLSWAALNIQGTTATLLVRERTVPPRKIDTGVPANVVAARDGQLVRLEVTDGRAVVQKGDAVRAGEILVSGVYEDRWGLCHLLRANAKVVARVPGTLTAEVPLLQQRARLTGRVVKRRYLELGEARVPLFLYRGLEGDCKVEKLTGPVTVFGLELPLTVTRETYIFYELDEQELSPEAALRIAERQLAAKERAAWGPDAIVKREAAAKTEGGKLTLTGEYLVEMDIARQVEIPVLDRGGQAREQKTREGGY